ERYRSMISAGDGFNGDKLDIAMLRRDKTEFPAEISLGVARLAEGSLFTSFIRDVTERKKYQQELERSLSLLLATLEATADGILVLDKRGQVTHFNRRLVELW